MVVALLGPQSGRFGQYLSHLVHNHGLEIKWKSLSWKIESLHFKVDLIKIIQFFLLLLCARSHRIFVVQDHHQQLYQQR